MWLKVAIATHTMPRYQKHSNHYIMASCKAPVSFQTHTDKVTQHGTWPHTTNTRISFRSNLRKICNWPTVEGTAGSPSMTWCSEVHEITTPQYATLPPTCISKIEQKWAHTTGIERKWIDRLFNLKRKWSLHLISQREVTCKGQIRNYTHWSLGTHITYNTQVLTFLYTDPYTHTPMNIL